MIERDNKYERNNNFQTVADIGRAIIILGVAIVLLFGGLFKLQKVTEIDPLLRYMFGATSLLYGSFRLYRGIKRD